MSNENYVLVIHGGAGTISAKDMTPEQDSAYRAALSEALRAGQRILEQNGPAVEAVEAAVKVLEDCPLFNAGKGAVFTHDGHNEMDAAIMDGLSLKAGAVAGVRTIKNPITAARAVMQKSNFVLLTGTGAEAFAAEQELAIVDTSYFFTPFRWEQLLRAKEENKVKLDHSAPTPPKGGQGMIVPPDALDGNNKYGTVGAVALDRFGNLAAATSTGGLTNKRYGRVGDSPIIGAGTYANNTTCAVSCTGRGEYFIRLVAAHTMSSLMEFNQLPLKAAANEVIHHRLAALRGTGGLIAVDRFGNYTMTFNTSGMYRGVVDGKGKFEVKIYKTR